MFEQGCTSFIGGDTRKKPCRDMQSQTQFSPFSNPNSDHKNKYENTEVFVFDKSGLGAKTWKFSKNINSKLQQSTSFVSAKPRKKVGRPRKIIVPIIHNNSDGSSLDTKSSDEKENVDSKEDMDSDKSEKAAAKHKDNSVEPSKSIKQEEEEIERTSKNDMPTCYMVSKRGRLIKPKVFSDAILSSIKSIKQEVISDDENSETNKFKADEESRFVDDSKNDKDFVVRGIGPANVEVYKCYKCDYKTEKYKELKTHQREHLHADRTCSYCGWICDSSVSDEEFEEHLKNHQGAEPYFCYFCNIRFKTRTKLFLHLPKHSKSRPFVCDICHAGFKWKHSLKYHMITHKNTKDYLCDICGFSTAHKTQLKAHHLIHTGDTFKCPNPGCDYQATKKSNLKFHMMTHTREKPHQCEVCGTSFSLVKNMKRHMLLHTNDRPYACSSCSFSTTRFDKLKEHCFKQHNIGEKPAKKFRLSEYIRMQDGEDVQNIEVSPADQDLMKASTDALQIGEGMETIELQVASEETGSGTTQIVNVTSSTGEAIPIAITQVGNDISYEIQQFPIQFVTQEVVTEH